MSGASTGRQLREAWLGIRQFASAVLSWLVGYPLTRIVPRDPGLTVVVGRQGPVFADNSKYFFIFASRQRGKGQRVVFLTGDRDLAEQIVGAGAEAVAHPTLRSLQLVLRATQIVTDMADWYDFGVYPLSRGAQVLQIWHGAPLKHIELDVYRKRLLELPRWMRGPWGMHKVVLGRYPVFDCVVTTSARFTDAAFRTAFRARQFDNTGYPRNDILFANEDSTPASDALVAINLDTGAFERVERAREQGKRIVLYVPTYRKDGSTPFDGPLSLERLSEFARTQDLAIVVKGHPLMQVPKDIGRLVNLIPYAPGGDVYPLMPLCDLLITDYSSIYLDFLLLDRPIVFFAFDLDDYLKRDSGMYFGYEELTPGPICFEQAGLEREIERTLSLADADPYSERRAQVRAFTHDHVDGRSAHRLQQVCGS